MSTITTWIGRCYDLLYADPFYLGNIEPFPVSSNKQRTGTKSTVAFQLNSSNSEQFIQTSQLKQLYYSSTGNTINTSYDYQLKTSSSISVTASATKGGEDQPKNSASMSLEYSTLDTVSLSQELTNTLTTVNRETYEDDLVDEDLTNPAQVPPLDPNYKTSLWLAATGSNANFTAFILKYGTHFANQVTMGGIGYQRMSLSTYDYAQLSEQGIDVNLELQLVLKSVAIGVGVKNSTDISESFKQTITSQDTSIRESGGSAIVDFNEWISTIDDSPVPIAVNLLSHDYVINSAYFPDQDAASLSAAQQSLAQKIATYIESNGLNMQQSVVNDGDTVFLMALPTDGTNDSSFNLLYQPNTAASNQTGINQPTTTAAQFLSATSNYNSYLWTIETVNQADGPVTLDQNNIIRFKNVGTAAYLDSEGAHPNYGFVTAAANTPQMGTSPTSSVEWSVDSRLCFLGDSARPLNSGDAICIRRQYSSANTLTDPDGLLWINPSTNKAASNGQVIGTQTNIQAGMAFMIFKV